MEGIVRIRLQEGAVSLIHSVIAENVIGKPMIVVAADHSTFFPQLQYLKIHARRVWMIHAAVKQITKQIQVIVLFEIHFFQQFHEPPAVVMYICNNIVHPKLLLFFHNFHAVPAIFKAFVIRSFFPKTAFLLVFWHVLFQKSSRLFCWFRIPVF